MDRNPSEQIAFGIHKEAFKKRLVVFLAFIVVGMIIWSSVAFQNIFSRYVLIIGKFLVDHPFLGSFIFVGLAAASALLSLFSSVPLVPLAVAVFGHWPTAVLLLLGWTIGGLGAYLIGSSAGYAAAKRISSPEEVEYYRKKIDRRTGFWLIVAFRLALPAEVAGYTLGAIRYHFWKFALATLLSEIPTVLLVVFSSQALLDRRLDLFAILIVCGLVMMVSMFRLIHFRIKGRD